MFTVETIDMLKLLPNEIKEVNKKILTICQDIISNDQEEVKSCNYYCLRKG